ncbi:MAG: hypothetical protein JNM69_25385 [Archangium sp.]|nr:hypothetical protein [Archangium sp.]
MTSPAASVQAFDGGFLVAWADARRLHLTSAPQSTRLIDDVWLKRVDPLRGVNETARIICPLPASASHPRLAVSRTTGTAALVWSEGRATDAGITHLARFDSSGVFDAQGPCGLQLPSPIFNDPEVSAKGSDFVVLLVSPLAIDRVDVVGQMTMTQTVTPQVHANVVTVEGVGATTFIGWRGPGGKLMLQRDGQPPVQVIESVKAFDLVAGTDGPAVAYVNDFGFFAVDDPASLGVPLAADTSIRPFGAAFDGGFAAIFSMDGGSTRLWSSLTTGAAAGADVDGTPEALAMRAGDGLAVVSHTSKTLGGVAVARNGNSLSFTGQPLLLSSARVLQRRPSLAWNAEAGAWAVVWEEASSASTWGSRWALVRPGSSALVASTELFVDGGWPRVLPTFDGGLAFFTQDGTDTRFFGLDDGGAQWVDTIFAVVRSGVAGPQTGLFWSGRSGLTHVEYVALGPSQTPLESTVAGEVTCATWFEGDFVVARLGVAGAVSLARFPDTAQPLIQGEPVIGSRACVASRPPGAPPQLGVVVAREVTKQLDVRTVDGGTWAVSLDAGVRDLQMTSVDGRWLVAWDTEAALFAGLFAEGQRPLVVELDATPAALRGLPAVSASSVNRGAIVWPVLQGDSVVLRFRELGLLDGGVDAGLDAGVDAGLDAGAGEADGGADAGLAFDAGSIVDAGPIDGGLADGGESVWVAVPACGCGASDGASSVVVLLLVLAWCGVKRRG